MNSKSSSAARRRLFLEPLESRLCLSFDVGFEAGILSIEGSREADSILIRDAGRGVTLVTDGDSGERWQFTGVTQFIVNTGEGDDSLRIADRFGDVANFDVDTGGGNDSVWIDLGSPVFQKVREGAALIKVDLGAGDDNLSAKARGAHDLDLDITAGEGDDNLLIGLLVPAVQKVRDAAARASVDLGEGNDRLSVNAVGFNDLDLDISAGGGDDNVLIGMLLPAIQKVRDAAARASVDLGEGNDRLSANAVGFNEMDLDISAGEGDDNVLIGLLVPAVQKVREAAANVDVDLGAGNDRLSFNAIGVHQMDLNLTAGEGDDNVLIGLLVPAVQKVRSIATLNVDLGLGADRLSRRIRGYETVDVNIVDEDAEGGRQG